jgi:hypothetical protein
MRKKLAMNYPVAQSTYQGSGVQPPQPWYYQPPYYAPLPQQVFTPQPRQHHGDGLLTFLVAIGFLFTWIDSRRQKVEIRQLQQQLSSLQHQTYTRGITMNQPQPISSGSNSEPIRVEVTATSFGDGTHFVGKDGVQPGLYRVTEPGLRYYVARLRNFTGQNAVLANWNGTTPGIIEILPDDAGIEARGGVIWRLFNEEKNPDTEAQ